MKDGRVTEAEGSREVILEWRKRREKKEKKKNPHNSVNLLRRTVFSLPVRM